MCKLARDHVKLVGMSIRGHVVWNDIHTGHLMFLLPLHPAILEPNLNLPLGEAQGVGYFDPSSSCQVPVEMKLLFQFQSLVPGVGCPLAFCFAICVHSTWKILMLFGECTIFKLILNTQFYSLWLVFDFKMLQIKVIKMYTTHQSQLHVNNTFHIFTCIGEVTCFFLVHKMLLFTWPLVTDCLIIVNQHVKTFAWQQFHYIRLG